MIAMKLIPSLLPEETCIVLYTLTITFHALQQDYTQEESHMLNASLGAYPAITVCIK